MPKFNPPESLDFSSPSQWQEWRDRFSLFRIATKLDKEEGVVQVSSLVYAMGREATNIYKSFTFGPVVDGVDPKNDYETVLQKFDAYFVPKRNIIHELDLYIKVLY